MTIFIKIIIFIVNLIKGKINAIPNIENKI